MKSIAIFVAASLLLEMLAPTLAHATQHSQGTQVEGDTRAETAEKAEEVAERVIQWLYEKDVRVMPRGEIDLSKLRKGWHAHVVYTSKGVQRTATGKILDKDADGMVVRKSRKSRAKSWKQWEIAYGDIDIVVVAQDPRDLERWQKLRQDIKMRTIPMKGEVAEQAVQMFYGKDVMVMSRGEIDPSKLRKGWHVYVVYTSKGVKETATSQIFDKDADGIVIQSRASTLWRADRERWDIAYEDIDTLAVAKDRRDIERWRRLTEGGLIVMSRGELDLSKLRTGWYADVVYTSEGAKRTITGYILDKDADGIVIQPRGRNWEQWEIAYGNIDILVAAQDPRDMKGWTEVRKVIQQLQEKVSKVRFIAPSISRGWIVGRLVKVSPDTFKIFTERDFDYVPHSQISNLEVSIGRRRNTDKGIIIGLGLGLTVLAPFVIGDNSGELHWLVAYYTTMFIALPVFISCTLIGAAIKSDIWAEVPPQRLNLSISPTPTRGLRAALSFNF